MPKTIQIRNVPEELHRKLKARAAERGMTLSDFLLEMAENLASRPTLQEMRARLEQIEQEPSLTLPAEEAPAEVIRRHRGEL